MIYEKWIPGYAGEYKADIFGNIISYKRSSPIILKPWDAGKGYLCVSLNNQSKKVHRLVAKTFYNICDAEINHKNGIKTDNRLENLEWCTRSENLKHAVATGLQPTGVKHPSAKLSTDQIKTIRQYISLKEKSYKEIASQFGISLRYVYQLKHNQYRKFD